MVKSMNKTLAISAITLVVVVMGLSTIAPTLQQAFAHDVTEQQGKTGTTTCPKGFILDFAPGPTGTHPDHNFNSVVCTKSICPGGQAACDDPIRIRIDDSFVLRH